MTVFLVIVFTALLLLAGALIDAARIMLATNIAQGALDSAVRSTLAGCHANLAGEFGLYGVKGDPEMTNKYFLTNLQEQQRGLNFVKYSINKGVEVEFTGNLLGKQHFKEQILQYMKYRAPLAVTEELLAGLTGSGWGEMTSFLSVGQKTAETRELLNTDLHALNRSIATVRSLSPVDEPETSTPDLLGTRRELRNIIGILDNTLVPRLLQYENTVHEFNRMSEASNPDTLPETEYLRSKAEALREKAQDTINLLDYLETAETKPGEDVNNLHPQVIRLRTFLGEMKEISWPSPGSIIFSDRADHEADRINEYLQQKQEFRQLNPEDLIPGDAFSVETAAAIAAGADYKLPEPGQDGRYQIGQGVAAMGAKKVLSFLSVLGRKVNDLARGARDDLYLAVYIMDKFTYLTSATPRDHYFQKGEVEYILCGDNSELTNVLSVCGQIFFVRFALNTLHSFLISLIPDPVDRLVYAVGEGLVKSGVDLYELYDGKRIPLFPGKTAVNGALAPVGANAPGQPAEKAGLGYSDHLLLLLLLQDEEIQLNRMRNLIQVSLKQTKEEPGFSLAEYNTICHAKAEVGIKLWFMPVLHLDKLGLYKFRDGQYLIVCESTVGF